MCLEETGESSVEVISDCSINMHNTSNLTDYNSDITERDDLVMDADWNLTISHVRGARQSGYMPEIAFVVKIKKASIAADAPCVPRARKGLETVVAKNVGS